MVVLLPQLDIPPMRYYSKQHYFSTPFIMVYFLHEKTGYSYVNKIIHFKTKFIGYYLRVTTVRTLYFVLFFQTFEDLTHTKDDIGNGVKSNSETQLCGNCRVSAERSGADH